MKFPPCTIGRMDKKLMRAGVLVFITIVLGCGGEGDERCASRDGLYRVQMAATSGNCGPIPDAVINSSSSGMAVAGCTGGAVDSDDGCSVSIDQVCPANGSPNRIVQRGKVDWTGDGSRGQGTIYIELLDPAGTILCAGTYGATFTRL